MAATTHMSRRERRRARRRERMRGHRYASDIYPGMTAATEEDLAAKERKQHRRDIRGDIIGAVRAPDRRLRRFPAVAATATVAAGEVSHLTGVTPLITFAGTAAAGGLLWWAKHKTVTWPSYASAAVGYTSAWSALVAGRGMTWQGPTDAYLLAGAVALSVPWAYRHRWQYVPYIEPAALGPELEEITEFQQIFRDFIAAPGTNRSTWQLTPEWEIPNGEQADVVVPRGQAATEDVLAAAKFFRSAYDRGPTEVFLEPTPDGRATRARLTVLKNDTILAAPRRWQGPTLDPSTGLAVIGTYPDGLLTHMQFFAPGSGTVDTFVAGTKGSGKSRFLDRTAGEIHLTPLGVLWINDPQEGQSLSEWIYAADSYAMGGLEVGFDRCLKQLRALRRIVYRRSAYHTHEIEWVDRKGRERKGGKTFFDPTPDLPFLYDLLDEAHVLVKHPDPDIRKEALFLLGEIAKLSRKTGIGLAYVAHRPDLDEMGGVKAGAFRSMLREGNVVAFRTGDASNHQMLGLRRDPFKLPAYFADGTKTQGLGLIKGPDGRDTVEFRGEYMDDVYAVAELPPGGRLDAMSAEAAAEPDDPELAPKTFMLNTGASDATSRPSVSTIPTAAEKQTWAERVLQVFADGKERSLGAVIKAFPADASDRSIRWGLKKLVADGLLETAGDKKPYRITDGGRAELAGRAAAAS